MQRFLLVAALSIFCAAPARAQQGRAKPLDDSPVVRAMGGDVGMLFRFGGLATMSAFNHERNVNNVLLITQAGVKFVLTDHWMLPVYFGTGLRVSDTSGTGVSHTDWGIDAGAGFEYHFRIWRRISPFVGTSLSLGLSDKDYSNNSVFSFGLGPSLGVEYYIGDRVSLAAQYQLMIMLDHNDGTDTTAVGLATQTGGAVGFAAQGGGFMTLTYYF